LGPYLRVQIKLPEIIGDFILPDHTAKHVQFVLDWYLNLHIYKRKINLKMGN
jgi:hypothetical protein